MKDSEINDKLDKIDNKVDKIDESVHSIDKTLISQAKQLEIHILRTNLAEENIEILRSQVKPLEKHVAEVSGMLKLIKWSGVVIGIIAGIVKIRQFFGH